jgi:uncharacterized protein YndB with AHSA1/START domain
VTPRVRLERTYRAPISRVFRALVDPAELVRWWGPPDVDTSAAEIDLRVGGACRWVMHPHGQRAVLHGRITELDPPRLLVMVHHWEGDDTETLVTMRLTDLGDRTRLELVHSRLPTTVDPDGFTRWWAAALDCLGHHLLARQYSGKDHAMPPTTATASLCRAYFDAWTNRRGPDALRPLLAEDFLFEAGPMRVQGREQFLAVAAWPAGATTEMVADAYDGDHGLQLYAATNAGITVKIAEHLTVRDGTIVATETITDRADFGAFLAAGE